jgi:hypothetical protein
MSNTYRMPVTEDEQIYTCRAMENYGGGFASRIAAAYYVADLGNRAKLLSTFEDLFRRYGPDSTYYCKD